MQISLKATLNSYVLVQSLPKMIFGQPHLCTQRNYNTPSQMLERISMDSDVSWDGHQHAHQKRLKATRYIYYTQLHIKMRSLRISSLEKLAPFSFIRFVHPAVSNKNLFDQRQQLVLNPVHFPRKLTSSRLAFTKRMASA